MGALLRWCVSNNDCDVKACVQQLYCGGTKMHWSESLSAGCPARILDFVGRCSSVFCPRSCHFYTQFSLSPHHSPLTLTCTHSHSLIRPHAHTLPHTLTRSHTFSPLPHSLIRFSPSLTRLHAFSPSLTRLHASSHTPTRSYAFSPSLTRSYASPPLLLAHTLSPLLFLIISLPYIHVLTFSLFMYVEHHACFFLYL
jgi:hypothetical protein